MDLGVVRQIQTIWTQFEYGTQFYQYLIETSVDGKHWSVFADKRNNRLAGSPMVDFDKVKARYVRLTFTGGQKNGFGGAVWNLKIFDGVEASARNNGWDLPLPIGMVVNGRTMKGCWEGLLL